MNIIITGASGFVGQNLSAYLESREYQVQKLSLRDPNWKQKINSKADAIIHLAGKAHDTKNSSAAEEYFKVNRDITVEVFNSFLKSEIKDFFFFSSVKAVADTVEGTLTENTKANPQTPYGKSKREAEEYLLAQKLPAGKCLFIIRPCMIHGPGNKGNLNLLYKIISKGLPYPLAAYQNQRSFCSVDNLCYIIYNLMDNPTIASGIYQIADDVPLSTNQLIRLIAESQDKKARIIYIPKQIIQFFCKFGDSFKLPFNTERLKKLTEDYVVSNIKIKNALGISNLPVETKEGLLHTLKSFKNKN